MKGKAKFTALQSLVFIVPRHMSAMTKLPFSVPRLVSLSIWFVSGT